MKTDCVRCGTGHTSPQQHSSTVRRLPIYRPQCVDCTLPERSCALGSQAGTTVLKESGSLAKETQAVGLESTEAELSESVVTEEKVEKTKKTRLKMRKNNNGVELEESVEHINKNVLANQLETEQVGIESAKEQCKQSDELENDPSGLERSLQDPQEKEQLGLLESLPAECSITEHAFRVFAADTQYLIQTIRSEHQDAPMDPLHIMLHSQTENMTRIIADVLSKIDATSFDQLLLHFYTVAQLLESDVSTHIKRITQLLRNRSKKKKRMRGNKGVFVEIKPGSPIELVSRFNLGRLFGFPVNTESSTWSLSEWNVVLEGASKVKTAVETYRTTRTLQQLMVDPIEQEKQESLGAEESLVDPIESGTSVQEKPECVRLEETKENSLPEWSDLIQSVPSVGLDEIALAAETGFLPDADEALVSSLPYHLRHYFDPEPYPHSLGMSQGRPIFGPLPPPGPLDASLLEPLEEYVSSLVDSSSLYESYLRVSEALGASDIPPDLSALLTDEFTESLIWEMTRAQEKESLTEQDVSEPGVIGKEEIPSMTISELEKALRINQEKESLLERDWKELRDMNASWKKDVKRMLFD